MHTTHLALHAAALRSRLAGNDVLVLRTVDGFLQADISGLDSMPYSSTTLGPCDEQVNVIVASTMLHDAAASLNASAQGHLNKLRAERRAAAKAAKAEPQEEAEDEEAEPAVPVEMVFHPHHVDLTCLRSEVRVPCSPAGPDDGYVPRLNGEFFEWTEQMSDRFRAALAFTLADNDVVTGQVHVEEGWVVALDGYTMVAGRLSDEVPQMELPAVVKLMAQQMLVDTTAILDGQRLQLEDELGRMVVPLYAGGHPFPAAWRQFLDERDGGIFTDDGWLEIKPMELHAALSRVSSIRGVSNVVLKLEGDELLVESETAERGFVRSRIDAKGEPAGVSVKYNLKQLIRVLNVVPAEFAMRLQLRPHPKLGPHHGPTMVTNAGIYACIQPIRSN